MPVCPPVSPCKGASIVSRCASCAMHKHFYAWKRLLYGWGTRLLRMETPPLWVGDVSFTDGNAAARTFGRAHRHRPYQPPSNPSATQPSSFLSIGEHLAGNLETRSHRRNGRGGACVPARTSAQRRFHPQRAHPTRKSGISTCHRYALIRKEGVSTYHHHLI